MKAGAINLFCPYQVNWINDRSPMKLAEKSRRIGFSYADAYESVEQVQIGSADVWYTSADLSAAREYIDYVADFSRLANLSSRYAEGEETIAVTEDGPGNSGSVVDEKKVFTLRVTFENGRRITAGSSNPNFFRSKGGAAKLDELAFHRDARQLVKAAHATAQFWGHQFSGWSSHKGENSYFNQLIKQARSGELKASVHRVSIYDAVEQGIVERILMRKKKLTAPPAPDAKARQEWLDGIRATCPDNDIWREEYECVPSSEESALLSYELIRAAERPPLYPLAGFVNDAAAREKWPAGVLGAQEALPVTDDPRELSPAASGGDRTNAPLYVGVDIGRQRDLTVFWAIAKIGDVWETRLIKTLKQASYDVQEQYLNLLMTTANVQRLAGDATGKGEMLMERARDRFGSRVEPVTFTAPVKSSLAMPLVRLFEDRRIRIPADAAIREGLHKVRKIITSAGNVRFDAKHDEDGHADEFWALALAYHAADDLRLPLPAPLLEKPLNW